MNKLGAEFFGTFWLVFGGCGSAVLAAAFPELGIGFAGVSLAFGLTVLTMAYTVGGISGGHFNPAVSLGLAIGGRFPMKDMLGYWVAQVLGGIAGAAVLYLIASGKAGFVAGGFASNGYDALSPGGYSLVSVLVMEVVMTAFFLIIILGSTSATAPAGFAPIAIGLGLTAHSSCFDPGLEHLGQSGPLAGCCDFCRQWGLDAGLGVLGCPARRCRTRRNHLEIAARSRLNQSGLTSPAAQTAGLFAVMTCRMIVAKAAWSASLAEREEWNSFIVRDGAGSPNGTTLRFLFPHSASRAISGTNVRPIPCSTICNSVVSEVAPKLTSRRPRRKPHTSSA